MIPASDSKSRGLPLQPPPRLREGQERHLLRRLWGETQDEAIVRARATMSWGKRLARAKPASDARFWIFTARCV